MKASLKFTFAVFILILLTLPMGCGKNEDVTIVESMNTDSLKWEVSSFPLDLRISEDLSPQSEALAIQAMGEWESVGRREFFKTPTSVPAKQFTSLRDYFFKDRSTNGIYLSKVPLDELGDDYLAVTQIYFEDGINADGKYNQILHIDIIINGYYFDFSSDPGDEKSYYILTVLLHEIGHSLGLGHSSEGIMQPGLSITDKSSTLGVAEMEALAAKYGNVEEESSYTAALGVEAPGPKKLKRVLHYLHKDSFHPN